MKPCISVAPLILELCWSWVVKQHLSCSSVGRWRPIICCWADIGRLDESLTYWTFWQADWGSRTVEAAQGRDSPQRSKAPFTRARGCISIKRVNVNWEKYCILKFMKIVKFKENSYSCLPEVFLVTFYFFIFQASNVLKSGWILHDTCLQQS